MSFLKSVFTAHQHFQINLLFQRFILIFLCILTCVGTPILLLLWIPNIIYKRVVITFAKVFFPDLRPILNPFSVHFSDVDMNHNPVNTSIVTVATLDGHLSLAQLARIFEENVIHVRMQDKTLKYPELQEYPISFMGHPFLKKEPQFDPKDHILEYQRNGANFSDTEIHQIMLNRPFSKRRSPWELLVFRNAEQTKTMLALKIHHLMCDARSVVKLLVECLGNQKLDATEAKFVKQNWMEQLKRYILMPCQFLRTTANFLESQIMSPGHLCQRRTFSKDKSPFFVTICPKIDITVVKAIAKISGAQTTSVITSAVVGAIEKYFETKKEVYEFSPKTFLIYLALPKEFHPETFSNHLYIGMSQISLGSENEAKRLKMCDKMYNNLRHGDHSRFLYFWYQLLTTYPKMIRTLLSASFGLPTGLSNIAGERKGFSIAGFPCIDFNISAGVQQNLLGIYVTIVSYKNNLQLCVTAKGSVLSREDTLLMGRLVENQLTNLNKTHSEYECAPL